MAIGNEDRADAKQNGTIAPRVKEPRARLGHQKFERTVRKLAVTLAYPSIRARKPE